MPLLPTVLTAGKILNRVAAEVGVAPVNDPYGTEDPTFQQLTYLLNIAGEELGIAYEWGVLQKEHTIVTLDTDSGDYPLPDDFNYIINQTGWERAENVPLGGPLSPQDWQYLLGRDLVTQTIYASFRLKQGYFSIFPQPPPNGLDIHFEYMSKNWVLDEDGITEKSEVDSASDTPMYPGVLISRYVKVKYLESKQIDSTKAQDDFNQMFAFITGQDLGAPVLSVSGRLGSIPYLNAFNSLPDTGYGIN